MKKRGRKYHWHVIYIRPRSEKKAYLDLLDNGVDTYLPLIKTLKQWSDRKKWVEEPLFKSYLFVRVSPKEYFTALNASVYTIRYITFEGKAVPVPEQQIEAIKTFITQEETRNVDLSDYKPGKSVEVIEGPMKGLQGNMVRVLGKQKIRVEIEGVGKALFIEIPAAFLRILGD